MMVDETQDDSILILGNGDTEMSSELYRADVDQDVPPLRLESLFA